MELCGICCTNNSQAICINPFNLAFGQSWLPGNKAILQIMMPPAVEYITVTVTAVLARNTNNGDCL